MEKIFSDNNTYIPIQRHPINKLIEDLKTMLKKWLQLKYITVDLHKRLNSTNAILSRAYGIPKILKKGFPADYCFIYRESIT